MARVFADAGGQVLAVSAGLESMQAGQFPPAGTTQQTAFDEATNAALMADLLANPGAYSLSGGVLRKNGQAVTPAAPGQAYADELYVRVNIVPSLGVATYSPTSQDLRVMFRFLLRQLVVQ